MKVRSKKRLIEIKGRTWQYDDLLVEFSSDPHSKEKQIHGLGLCEPEPRALLIQPVEVEELHSREGLFEEVSTIRDAVDMPFAIVFLAVEDWNQLLPSLANRISAQAPKRRWTPSKPFSLQ